MRSWLCIAAFLLALASCGTPTGQRTAPATEANRFGAPVVESPRDASPLLSDPCRALATAGGPAGLGLDTSGRQREAFGRRECTWTTPDREELSMYVVDQDLLAATYRTARGGFFVPLTIEGMPAVIQKSGSGDINICTITTGLAPTQGLEATWVGTSDTRPGNDACTFAERASALVIRELPALR